MVIIIMGTENAYFPFFSPDNEWIGFFGDGKLKKIAVGGGAAVTLCDAPRGCGGSWGDDGNIHRGAEEIIPGACLNDFIAAATIATA
jgi:hypothetical protein